MTHPLIAVHAALGELAGFAFLWAFVEMLGPSPERIKRAQFASIVGLALVVASWLTGGFYYVNYYGASVKPLIKEGPSPWAHLIFMETKEHVFLFLPFIAATATALILAYGPRLQEDRSARRAFQVMAGLSVIMVLAVAAMGFIVTSGYRDALAQAHLASLPMIIVGLAAASAATRASGEGKVVASDRLPLWAFYVGTLLAFILVTILTIGAELNDGLKGWLKETFYHHWIGKGVLAVITFLVVIGVAAAFGRTPTNVYRWSLITLSATFLLGAVLLIFFTVEFFL
jgi:magnesium-transporting ATPase (P-type)